MRCEGDVADDCLNPLTYVFQDFALLPWRTVAGNVALVLEDRLPRGERAARVAEVLALTGLAEFADAWPRQLSGGMRQRVGIARALAVRPACLLMDEPLSALDAQTRGLLLDEFAALIERAGTTTVYVTHNLAEAVRLGQQIVVLSRRPGRVRAVRRIDRPLAGRAADDADLQADRSGAVAADPRRCRGGGTGDRGRQKSAPDVIRFTAMWAPKYAARDGIVARGGRGCHVQCCRHSPSFASSAVARNPRHSSGWAARGMSPICD